VEFSQHDDCRMGDRVRLMRLDDDYSNLRPGDMGTVKLIDRFGTIHVAWDDGSYSGLVPAVDRWEAI
jgi:hypothetical protein